MNPEMMEVWREFAKGYDISNLGRVRSRRTRRTKILKTVRNSKGYVQIGTSGCGRFLVSRLVAKMFVPNPRPDIFNQVDHINRDKTNNSWLNLRWLSGQLNVLAYRLPEKFKQLYAEAIDLEGPVLKTTSIFMEDPNL